MGGWQSATSTHLKAIRHGCRTLRLRAVLAAEGVLRCVIHWTS
jgi:hypothetical protein